MKKIYKITILDVGKLTVSVYNSSEHELKSGGPQDPEILPATLSDGCTSWGAQGARQQSQPGFAEVRRRRSKEETIRGAGICETG